VEELQLQFKLLVENSKYYDFFEKTACFWKLCYFIYQIWYCGRSCQNWLDIIILKEKMWDTRCWFICLVFTAKPNILPGRSRRLCAKMVQSNRRGSDTYVWSTIIDKLAMRRRRLWTLLRLAFVRIILPNCCWKCVSYKEVEDNRFVVIYCLKIVNIWRRWRK
jgi:hypothetical protein